MSFWRQPGFWLNVLLVTVGGAIVLLLGQDTLRETAFTVLMFIALASSLNIIMGFAGYVNFGHIVFFGLGGYFGFFLLSELGWPLYLAMIAGGCLSRGPRPGRRRRGAAAPGRLLCPGHHRHQ